MTMSERFPDLDPEAIRATCDAVHAYSQVLGDWRAACLPRRKHWWQLTVYPSVRGLTTGMVRAGIDFELELDLLSDRLLGHVTGGGVLSEPLGGRPAAEVAELVEHFLLANGIDRNCIPVDKGRASHARVSADYSTDSAANIASAFRHVSAALGEFRAGIAEETSPIQVWPHHFDLAMLWLPGEKIPGQDPADEEYSDKQMNFGFTLGDAGIPEPYFYATAYPLPDALASLALPQGTRWQTEGFSGAVLRYRTLLENERPADYLLSLWNSLLASGRQNMLTKR
jgi:hypothetical protein